MKIKPDAILFDMDGVLVDSIDSWFTSLNHALKAFNIDEISRDEFLGKYWGHDLYDNLDRMGLDHEIGRLCNNLYGENISHIKFDLNTKDILDQLKAYRKGIITNTPKDSAFKILEKFDIEHFFDVIITSDDVKKAKPNPEIVLKACKVLGVEPEKVILIGDTDSDVKAGKAANCIVVGLKIDGDYTINNLSELTTLIQQ
jgi:phosphoglycolate phosphatase-like HAD superfamily hydrolase